MRNEHKKDLRAGLLRSRAARIGVFNGVTSRFGLLFYTDYNHRHGRFSSGENGQGILASITNSAIVYPIAGRAPLLESFQKIIYQRADKIQHQSSISCTCAIVAVT